jgi:hypothetical protein
MFGSVLGRATPAPTPMSPLTFRPEVRPIHPRLAPNRRFLAVDRRSITMKWRLHPGGAMEDRDGAVGGSRSSVGYIAMEP